MEEAQVRTTLINTWTHTAHTRTHAHTHGTRALTRSAWNRALLTPAFSSSNLRLVAKVTVDNTNTLFAKWDQQRKTTQLGEVLDVHVDEDTMRVRKAILYLFIIN